MPWFKVDDRLAFHPKVIAAGNVSMGLWVRAGAWASAHLTDGHVPSSLLASLGATRKHAEALVKADLWTVEPGGYRFRDWTDWQPSAHDAQLVKEAERAAGQRGNHLRWHKRRGVVDNDCRFCRGDGRVPDRIPDQVPESGGESGPRSGWGESPVPVPYPYQSVVTEVSQVQVGDARANGLDRINDDDLKAIAAETRPGDLGWAKRVAADVLGRAGTPPRQPTAYVLQAVRTEPARYAITPTPPRPDEQCPTHAGQWADSCSGCAVDRIVG